MACEILSGIFKAKSHRSFIIPLAILGLIGALLPVMNLSTTLQTLRSDQVMPFVALPITFLIPLVIALVYRMREKKLKPQIQKMQISGQTPPKI
jgi:hypothetical protein